VIGNHARVIVLLIDSSQIDNDFMATIASFATHVATPYLCASYINRGASRTLNLTFVLSFRVPFRVPAFRLSQSPQLATVQAIQFRLLNCYRVQALELQAVVKPCDMDHECMLTDIIDIS